MASNERNVLPSLDQSNNNPGLSRPKIFMRILSSVFHEPQLRKMEADTKFSRVIKALLTAMARNISADIPHLSTGALYFSDGTTRIDPQMTPCQYGIENLHQNDESNLILYFKYTPFTSNGGDILQSPHLVHNTTNNTIIKGTDPNLDNRNKSNTNSPTGREYSSASVSISAFQQNSQSNVQLPPSRIYSPPLHPSQPTSLSIRHVTTASRGPLRPSGDAAPTSPRRYFATNTPTTMHGIKPPNNDNNNNISVSMRNAYPENSVLPKGVSPFRYNPYTNVIQRDKLRLTSDINPGDSNDLMRLQTSSAGVASMASHHRTADSHSSSVNVSAATIGQHSNSGGVGVSVTFTGHGPRHTSAHGPRGRANTSVQRRSLEPTAKTLDSLKELTPWPSDVTFCRELPNHPILQRSFVDHRDTSALDSNNTTNVSHRLTADGYRSPTHPRSGMRYINKLPEEKYNINCIVRSPDGGRSGGRAGERSNVSVVVDGTSTSAGQKSLLSTSRNASSLHRRSNREYTIGNTETNRVNSIGLYKPRTEGDATATVDRLLQELRAERDSRKKLEKKVQDIVYHGRTRNSSKYSVESYSHREPLRESSLSSLSDEGETSPKKKPVIETRTTIETTYSPINKSSPSSVQYHHRTDNRSRSPLEVSSVTSASYRNEQEMEVVEEHLRMMDSLRLQRALRLGGTRSISSGSVK